MRKALKLAGLILLFLIVVAPVFGQNPFNINNYLKGFLRQNGEKQKENLILPDLKTSAPKELYIEELEGARKIRFSTTTFNEGKADLKIIGKSDTENEVTRATQIYLNDKKEEKRKEIGSFVFHPGHEHWHVEKFTEFQLWSLKNNDELDKLVTTTDKMSFCLFDETQFNDRLENFSAEVKFPRDCDTETQGISVGWSDTYTSVLPGQELDITKVGDGRYAVKSIVNPDRKILESNYNNNSVTSLIEITEGSIQIID